MPVVCPRCASVDYRGTLNSQQIKTHNDLDIRVHVLGSDSDPGNEARATYWDYDCVSVLHLTAYLQPYRPLSSYYVRVVVPETFGCSL